MEKHSGSKLFPLVFFDQDKPFGAIPLFYMKKMGLKMVFSPPPGTFINLGPVLLNQGYKQYKFEMVYQDFQRSIDKYIGTFGANYINIATSSGLQDIRPFAWAHYQVIPNYTYKIDLRQGEKEIWSNFSRTLKQNIVHSLAKGMEVGESRREGNEGIDYLYDSLKKRYAEEHIKLSLEKTYLLDLKRELGNSSLKLLLATYEGKAVGAILFTMYRDVITAWMGSVRNDTNGLDVNGCIYRKIICEAIQDGYKWLEMIGANTPQICMAKSRYNPNIEIQFQIKKADLLTSLVEKVYSIRKYHMGN